MKTMSPFKKSVLSIVILSAVTGSFISWDKYQPRHETESLVEFYENRNIIEKDFLLGGTESSETAPIIDITEDQLIEEAEIIAQEFADSVYSPESGESYGKTFQGVLENEEILLVEERVQSLTVPSEEDNHESLLKAEIMEIELGGNILFAFDSSKVTDEYFPLLNETAKSMQSASADKDKIWQVVGYADLDGNYIYNSKLAKKRANAVAEYLVNKGVDEDQLITVSLGASQAVPAQRDDEHNRLERRVEIHEFKEELALLSDQFNLNLEREIAQRESKRLFGIQQALVEQQLVESDSQEIQLSEGLLVEGAVESAPQIDFEQQKIQSITTVMEL